MKKLGRTKILLEHYIQTAEIQSEEWTVRLWKPKTMGLLPAWNMKELMQSCSFGHSSCGRPVWKTSNYDAGYYDAQIAFYIEPLRRTIDVYICSILIRPFSEEARVHYEDRMGYGPMVRLLLMWDSRQFDKEHGYKASPAGDFYKESKIEYADMYHVINEITDIEDSTYQ